MPIKNIAIACQGGGSHAAFTAGALPGLLPQFSNAGIAASGGKDSPLAQQPHESLLLTGISGTSGGAISALLAWFGFLTGGAQAARDRLDGFWSANCAQLPGERLFNEATRRLAGMSTVDLKLSPYLFPLRDLEQATTRTWPMMAGRWPPLQDFARADYFELRQLVAPFVDFELVGALGEFCGIPLEVKRWRACTLQARIFDAAAPRQAQIVKAREAIEERIRRGLAAARWIGERIARDDLPPGALLRAAFDGWQEPACTFTSDGLDRLAQAVRHVSYCIPQLLVGAVDVESGAFTAFSSERAPEDAGITLDAVLASASLPWLFEATMVKGLDPDTQEERQRPYWDGLFSQNPPIRNFMSGLLDETKKPDGVWVVQINQDQFDFSRRIADGEAKTVYGNEIWHRRDALSGNLSLNQEIAFIEAVNRRLDDPCQGARAQDKPIEVARIVMDGAAVGAAVGRELDAYSKFDRDRSLKQALWTHGGQQAAHFLALRANADRLCDELAATLKAMGARTGGGQVQARAWQAGRNRIFGALVAPDVLTLDRSPDGPRGADAPQAMLRWHVVDAMLDGEPVDIIGKTALCADGGGWRLGETSLLNVQPKAVQAEEPAAPAAGMASPQLESRLGMPMPNALVPAKHGKPRHQERRRRPQ
jgi:predicted acylesterase/phospholipase RssA